MQLRLSPRFRSDLITSLVFLLACWGIACLDLFPKPDPEPGSKERAVVIDTNNDDLQEVGILQMGSQMLTVKVATGPYAGRRFRAFNQLRANIELDKVFEEGDSVLVGIPEKVDDDTVLTAQDYYRLNSTIILFGLFCALLLVFSGITGFKALVSFVFSCFGVWKIVVPLCLRGYSPIWICIFGVLLLTVVIMFLVAGFTRKCLVSTAGAMLGVLMGCALSLFFTRLFHVNGAVMTYSQVLLYSGFEDLNLQELFAGAIILASSGAVMDLGMDVASGMEEIVLHKPDITRGALIASGIRIGQSVVGTMTTTLLLAYSGGYLTLMMAFVAQGTRAIDFINNPFVASEAVKTLIGSFALVLVAPATALVGGLVYKTGTRKTENEACIETSSQA